MKVEPKQEVKQELSKPVVKSKLGEPSQQSEPDEPRKPVFTVDISHMHCTMHGTPGNDEQTVALQAGPNGLLTAKFGDLVHTTELCNLMLIAKKPKKNVKKKPAAPVAEASVGAAAPVEAAPVAAAPPAPMAPVVKDYGIMYYGTKNRNFIGIRAKFGAKNQVLSFGGTKCTKTKDEMRSIADVIVADLKGGMSVEDAKNKGTALAFA